MPCLQVFTGKTLALQLVEIAKPFLIMKMRVKLEDVSVAKREKGSAEDDASGAAAEAAGGAGSEAAPGAVTAGEGAAGEGAAVTGVGAITNTFELQNKLNPCDRPTALFIPFGIRRDFPPSLVVLEGIALPLPFNTTRDLPPSL